MCVNTVNTFDYFSNKKAKTVKETWGRRCNVLIFVSSEEGKNEV